MRLNYFKQQLQKNTGYYVNIIQHLCPKRKEGNGGKFNYTWILLYYEISLSNIVLRIHYYWIILLLSKYVRIQLFCALVNSIRIKSIM